MWRKAILGMALAAVVTLAGAGCGGSDGDGGGFEFVNNSSYTVTVEPGTGENFSAFALAPGQDKKIGDSKGDSLDFVYGPANVVRADNTPGLTVFRDR